MKARDNMRGVLLLLAMSCTAMGLEVEPIQMRDTPIPIEHAAGERVSAIFARAVEGQVVWRFLPEKHFFRSDTQTIMSAPPGEYMITVGGSKIVKVMEEDGSPPPKPEPDGDLIPEPEPEPAPEPQPEPDTDKIDAKWAIWLEEQDDRQKHPEATSVMMDRSFRTSLYDRGLKVVVYDDDQAEAKRYQEIVARARTANNATTLPVWILLAGDGKRFLVVPAPTSIEAAEALLRKHVK